MSAWNWKKIGQKPRYCFIFQQSWIPSPHSPHWDEQPHGESRVSSSFPSISCYYSAWFCQEQNQPGEQLQENKDIYPISFLCKKTSQRNTAILYVWGEKLIFLHRCASSVTWQSCGNSSPMILQRNSIAMTSQGGFNLQLNGDNTGVCLTAALMQIAVHGSG